jgi:hypothetical protein
MQGPNYAGYGWFGARPMQGLGYGSLELQREKILEYMLNIVNAEYKEIA